MNFIIRWLVTAIAVGVAVWIVPGMDLLGGTDAWVGIAIFGLILSLINISIKPIMQVLSLPISVITLGIFYLVVNTLMLYIAAWLANGIFQSGTGHRLVRQRVRGLHRHQHRIGAGERIGRQGTSIRIATTCKRHRRFRRCRFLLVRERSETIGRVVCVNSERRSHANTTTAVQWARQKLGRRTSKAARAPAYT